MLGDMPRGRPSTTPRTSFGKRLLEARQRAGLTQAELGEKLGLSQRAVAHWEHRRSPMYADQIVTLCEVLGVTAEWLLGIEPPQGKRGRPSKLQRQLEQIEKLPRADQTYVSRFLAQVLIERGQGDA